LIYKQILREMMEHLVDLCNLLFQ